MVGDARIGDPTEDTRTRHNPPVTARRPTPLLVLGALVLLVVVGVLVHVKVGSYFRLTFGDILREIGRGDAGGTDAVNNVVWRVRLPRTVACVTIGAMLGLVGSAFQALFRNPLAEPYVVGVSSGAAVGGVTALTLGWGTALFGLGTLALASVGGGLALMVVYALSYRRGVVDVRGLLLAGVVIGSMLSSILTLMILAAGQDANNVLRWLLGSMGSAYWSHDAVLTVCLVFGGAILVRESRRLNAFALGEDTAQRLGVDTSRLKRVILATGTVMTAACVGAVGVVGFLGLVAPHIARRLLGVDWRWSLAGSGLVGAVLLLGSDVLAQNVKAVTEMPVGAVTAILGAPSLVLLMRARD